MQCLILHSFSAVPVLRAEDVIVVEMDSEAVVVFTRFGDLSRGSRFNVRLMPGSATSRKLPYHSMYECTRAWLLPG